MNFVDPLDPQNEMRDWDERFVKTLETKLRGPQPVSLSWDEYNLLAREHANTLVFVGGDRVWIRGVLCRTP